MLRKNTTTGYLEFWDPSTSTWIGIGEFSANGGSVSDSGGYRYHYFRESGTFTVVSGAKLVDFLIVAGVGAYRDWETMIAKIGRAHV